MRLKRIMKHESRIMVFAIIALFMIHNSLFIIPAYAACNDPDVTKRGPECPAGLDQIEQIVGQVVSVIVGLGFIAMLVLLVMAGFKYLTSAGEPKAVAAAHSVVTWALLGILFMAMAWLILQLVESFTGIKVTTFDIKTLCTGPGGVQFCSPSPKP